MKTRIQDNVTGLQHIGIPSCDVKRSIQWYVNTLGFICIEEKILADGTQAAFVKKGNLVLELYTTDEKDRTEGRVDHFALNVQNIEDAFEAMKQADCTILDDEIQILPFFEKGVRFFTILGPSGEKIEFNQMI